LRNDKIGIKIKTRIMTKIGSFLRDSRIFITTVFLSALCLCGAVADTGALE